MGIFQNNILKPEELNGGFAPLNDGDETFALNSMDSYPGDLPDFAVLDSYLPSIDESVNDFVSDTNSVESLTDSDIAFEDTIPEVSDADYTSMFDEQNFSNSTSTEDVNDIFASAFPDSNNEFDSAIAPVNEYPDVIDSSEPEVPFVGEINNDDELEKLLRSSMEEEKSINEAESTINQELADVNIDNLFADSPIAETVSKVVETVVPEVPSASQENTNSEFKEIDDAVEINIDNVYPEHLSKAGINNKVPEPTPEPIPVIEEKQAKVKKPINKKLFKRIAYIAAALVLMAGAGVGVYYSGLVGTVTHLISGDSHSDTTEVAHNAAAHKTDSHKSDAHTTEHKPAEHSQEATHDTNEQHNAQEAEKVTTPAENQAVHANPAEQHTDTHKDAEVTHPKEVTSHKEKVQPTIEHKKEAQLPKAIKEKSKHETKAVAKHEPVHTAAKVKEKTPNKEKTTEKIAKVKSNEKVAMKTPVEKPITKIEPKPETEVYVIQIYASPSKEDAQEWLKKVQKRIGAEAYISTQLVRDKVWYRVRCGHYTSKESATAAAEKYGFSQSWVDRIR